MTVDNPVSVTLPEDIRRAVETAKNQVTLLDAEATRLGKLTRQLNAEIKDLHVQKEELGQSITELKLTNVALSNAKNSLNDEITVLKSELEKDKDYHWNLIAEAVNKTAEADTKLSEALSKEQATETKSQEVSQREAAVIEAEKNISDRLLKLKESLSNV